jgi:hypothetical protein
MAGCFGGSHFDRHMESQLMRHLDDTHHPACMASEDHEDKWEVDEEGYGIQPECTCHEEYANDKCDAQLSRMEDY